MTNSHLSILAEGFVFPESARWRDDRLWFCDWGTSVIWNVGIDGLRRRVGEIPTKQTSKAPQQRGPFCLDWLPDGRMIVVSGQDRQLLALEPGSQVPVYADLSSLSDNPWNDIVIDAQGLIYVNSPAMDSDDGAIALIQPNGKQSKVADGLQFPNGMAITSDGRSLIVAESMGKRLTAFSIRADGRLAKRRTWAMVEGHPDGICIDAGHNVWYADVPNQECVLVAEGGHVLRTVPSPKGCFDCALAGSEQHALLILASEWRGFEYDYSGENTGCVYVHPLKQER
ncbi:MAG TPA: SMP-30/gluconolactonase/LRE family protein [Candidatus Eremiobacteraceae bacterium]